MILDRVSDGVMKGIIIVLELFRSSLLSHSFLLNIMHSVFFLVNFIFKLFHMLLPIELLLIVLHLFQSHIFLILFLSLSKFRIHLLIQLLFKEVGIILRLFKFLLIIGILNFEKLLTSIKVIFYVVLKLIGSLFKIVSEFGSIANWAVHGM